MLLTLTFKKELKKCGHSSVVERLVANEKVEGSTPFARSKDMNNNKKLSINEIFNLAIENQKKKNFQIAKDLYSQILKLNPTSHEVYNNLGLIFGSYIHISFPDLCKLSIMSNTALSL